VAKHGLAGILAKKAATHKAFLRYFFAKEPIAVGKCYNCQVLDLKNLTLEKIERQFDAWGWPAFKAREVFSFVHQKLKGDLAACRALTKGERAQLAAACFISANLADKIIKGKLAQKAVFKFGADALVETVCISPSLKHQTVCVSSQVGCPVKCEFCATGKMNFKRNLSTAEILSQVYGFAGRAESEGCGGKITNVVFMGMGEPFLNYENVLRAAKILNHKLGLNLAARKIVFSTIGIIEGMQKLAKEQAQFRLAWSLAAPFDALRRKLIPYKKLPSIDETISAIKEYQRKTGRRITIEYVVLEGVNDDLDAVRELAKISQKIDCNVNLIPYNPSPGLHYRCGQVTAAAERLTQLKVNVAVRRSLGSDIAAACGQLIVREHK
jgi:23S rRNA (adenine2503-C2)-methyltransferase